MKVEIKNWNDLKDQFGLKEREDGYYNAKQISRKLYEAVMNAGDAPLHIEIPVGNDKEAVCCFGERDERSEAVYYTYTGTAN